MNLRNEGERKNTTIKTKIINYITFVTFNG